MTISSSRTREFNVERIILMAYRAAGLMSESQDTGDPSWAAKSAAGIDWLDVILDQADANVILRNTVFLDVATVDGTSTYTLGTSYIDLIGDGMYLPTGQTTGETVVTPMSRQEWQSLSDKVSTGRPYRYYLHRTASPTIYLWPPPNEDGSIRFQAQQLVADVGSDGANTVDIDRYWTMWLILELAGILAMSNSLPEAKVLMLQAKAKAAREDAESKAQSSGDVQIYIDHPTPWSR